MPQAVPGEGSNSLGRPILPAKRAVEGCRLVRGLGRVVELHRPRPPRSGRQLGGLIHVLLVIAVVVILIQVIQGRRH
jgi:hypothetical protein